MKLIKLFFITIVLLFSSSKILAQNSIEEARDFIKQEKHYEASKILYKYYKNHPNDKNAGWLLAITLHQSQYIEESQKIYWDLGEKYPYDYDIKLDRINKLTEAGQLKESQYLIDTTLKNAPKDYIFEAQKTLAQMNYWEGNYDQATLDINKALKIYPNENAAKKIKQQIENITKNKLDVSLQIFDDKQPLSVLKPDIETTFYLSSKLSVGGSVSYPFYILKEDNISIPWLQGFAKYNLKKSKANVKLKLGLFTSQNTSITPTASVAFYKKLTKFLAFDTHIDYEPYTATIHAVEKPIMRTKSGLALKWNNPDGIIGQIAFDNHSFSSINNSFYSISAWAMSPPFEIDNLRLRGGYGFNYSDAKKNTFSSEKTITEVNSEWEENYQIDGVYNPFFSPENQSIHTLVALADYRVNTAFQVHLNAGYGFSAQAKSPYLYLSEDEEGDEVIRRDFSDLSFHPFDVGLSFDYMFSPNLSFKGFYKFQETYYYQSNLTGVSAHILF